MRTNTNLRESTLLLLLLGLFTLVALVASISLATQLRPIADDYCLAGYAQVFGPVGAIGHWYQTWSGDFVLILGWNLLVGLPSVLLPLEYLFVPVFVVLVACIALVTSIFTKVVQSRWFAITVAGLLSIGWITHYWVAESADGSGRSRILAETLTHWQTVNVVYVIVPAVLIWAVFRFLPAYLPTKEGLGLMVAGLVGLVAGSSGLVLGFSLAALAFLSVIFRLFARSWPPGTGDQVIFGSAAVLGLVLSLVAPGARARSGALPSTSLSDSLYIALTSPPKILSRLVEVFVGYQLIVPLLIGVLIGTLSLLEKRWRFDEALVIKNLVGLSVLLVLLVTFATISGRLLYSSHWHFVSSSLVSFLIWFGVGVLLGAKIGGLTARQIKPREQFLISAALGVVVLSLLVSGFLGMRSSISERLVAWEAGPAPVASASDREEAWVSDCWAKMESESSGLASP